MENVKIVSTGGNLTIFRTSTKPKPKTGKNPVSVSLATAVHTRDGGTIFQKPIYSNVWAEQRDLKNQRTVSRLMNCKTVDKFDYGEHPAYPKPEVEVCRKLERNTVIVFIQAGGEIHVDPWKHERKIIYKGAVQGQCGFDDVAALIRDGIVKRESLPNGYFKYVKAAM